MVSAQPEDFMVAKRDGTAPESEVGIFEAVVTPRAGETQRNAGLSHDPGWIVKAPENATTQGHASPPHGFSSCTPGPTEKHALKSATILAITT
jgi:hypothetical protein